MLAVCRAAAEHEPAAAAVLARWEEWEEALQRGCGRSERRFHRRCYERARDAAMGTLLMRLTAAGTRTRQHRRSRRAPATRLDVLLRQQTGARR